MPERRPINPTNLLIDTENPRLREPNQKQRDAIRALAKNQGRKLLALARDIADFGINPADLPIVMPLKGDGDRYIVLEGNRRIVALKALENADSLKDAVDKSIVAKLRSLGDRYRKEPIESIDCLVVKDREEARHWIELRHGGELGGAGVVGWESEESTRFRQRSGHPPIHTQVLDFLEQEGKITPQERQDVPATSLKRVLGTPEVRAVAGIGLKDGKVTLLANKKSVAKALDYITRDLAYGDTKVGHIYSKDDRVEYANGIPKSIRVSPTLKSGPELSAGDAPATRKAKTVKPANRQRARDRLIPSDCVLNVTDARVRDIVQELRALSLDKYPNAVSVLLRVFFELSTDAYCAVAGIGNVHDKLQQKMETTVKDLLAHKRLSDMQARPVRRACQRGSFLAPSVDFMHDYIHAKEVFPAPGDLRAHWDSLQAFAMAIWHP